MAKKCVRKVKLQTAKHFDQYVLRSMGVSVSACIQFLVNVTSSWLLPELQAAQSKFLWKGMHAVAKLMQSSEAYVCVCEAANTPGSNNTSATGLADNNVDELQREALVQACTLCAQKRMFKVR